MGLDMYLSQKTYIQNWNYMKPKEKHKIIITKNNKKIRTIQTKRISYITEEVACWRKANQIHNWFVENIQDKEDDCKEYFVAKSQLKKLLSLIEQTLKTPAKAKKILPTQPGFFFGDNTYDKYYFEELVETQKTLTKILKEKGEGDFYYQSSW